MIELHPNGTAQGPSPTGVSYRAHFLFHSARIAALETPFPSVRTGDCLAAARSRRGSDMPPACHSLPRRRFATLKGAALRGKDLGLAHWLLRTLLAPLLGELSA